MDVSSYHHAGSISIARPPDEVYAIVSDITRIGELSPVCQAGTWKDPAQSATEGAWFTGHNAIGDYTWDTQCEVVAAQPGRAFAFINHGPEGDAELVRWGFLLEAEGTGTRVTEDWQVLPAYPDFVTGGDATIDVRTRIEGMAQMARDGISGTLANLKRVAETST